MWGMPIIMAERKGKRADGCLLQHVHRPGLGHAHCYSTGQRESHGQGQHHWGREVYSSHSWPANHITLLQGRVEVKKKG